MAGDWIKMRAALCTHPKVVIIAEIIGESTEVGRRLSTGFNGSLCEIVTRDVTRDVTLASLMRVWCATNEHTSDGVWRNSTLATIDAAAGLPGFGDAMAAAGWAIVNEQEHTVTLPDFLENNSPAKRGARSSGAERQARYRAKSAGKTSNSDASRDVTSNVTSDAREEKRREEKNTPKAPTGGDARFDEFWKAYPKKVGKDDARKAFAKRKVDAEMLASMLNAIASQACSMAWTKDSGQFIPNPSTWLNGGRWQDGDSADAVPHWQGAV